MAAIIDMASIITNTLLIYWLEKVSSNNKRLWINKKNTFIPHK